MLQVSRSTSFGGAENSPSLIASSHFAFASHTHEVGTVPVFCLLKSVRSSVYASYLLASLAIVSLVCEDEVGGV